MAENNSTILAKAWLNGTNDYQQRVPEVSQAGVARTMEFLFDPMNKNYYNQFCDFLINRIGGELVRQKSFTDPLAFVDSSDLIFGTTISETAFSWVKAHSYTDDAETLFKVHRPEGEQVFHSINRQDVYPISVNRVELQRAAGDDYGLNQYVSAVMEIPYNSDNYDSLLYKVQQIAEYEARWGFYKYELSAEPTSETTGKEFLTAAQVLAGRMRFPSTLYNAQVIDDIPVFVNNPEDELILITTPEVAANLNVNTYSGLFNLNVAELKYRIVTIPEFPITGAVALLTVRDFFISKNVYRGIESFYNPQTLGTNYYLHHQAIISVSPFVPAILFTTNEGTATNVITMTATSLTATADTDELNPGETAQITLTLNGTLSDDSDDDVAVAPSSAIYTVTASTALGVAVDLNSRTYVDDYGVLHTQRTGWTDGDVITVTCVTTYIDPSGSGKVSTLSAVLTFTVNVG